MPELFLVSVFILKQSRVEPVTPQASLLHTPRLQLLTLQFFKLKTVYYYYHYYYYYYYCLAN